MAKEFINPPNVFDARKKMHFSQAIKTGNTIYLAGQVAWDENGNLVGKGDFEAQERQTFENIKRILQAAGASMKDIVWILWLCRDIKDGLKVRQTSAYKEYFGDHDPPGTLIQVVNLGGPDTLLEVQVIAVVD